MVKNAWHSPTKTKKHLETYEKSHILSKFLSNENCFNNCTDDCFFYLGKYIKKVPIKDKGSPLHKMVRPCFIKNKKKLKLGYAFR